MILAEKRFSLNGTNWTIKLLIESMKSELKLSRDFYVRDVLEVAPELPGKNLVIILPDGLTMRFKITEVEAYRGAEDLACHASKGRTARTEIMFREGGRLYIYLIYGVYWMLNVVAGGKDDPQAVLIRGVENYPGPGILTRSLGIDKSYYGEDLVCSKRIWIEDAGLEPTVRNGPRIGIDYAGEYWKSRPWRYYILL
jgi:DNA-3-methyladenine glycosylase